MDKELYKKVQEIDVDWIDDEYKVKVLEAIELMDSNDLQHKKAVFERTLEYIDLRNDGCIKRLIDEKSWMWTDCNGKPYHYDLKGWCENELLESRNVNPILLYLSFKYELLKVVGEIKDEAKNKRLQELKSREPINHSSQHKQASKRASSKDKLPLGSLSDEQTKNIKSFVKTRYHISPHKEKIQSILFEIEKATTKKKLFGHVLALYEYRDEIDGETTWINMIGDIIGVRPTDKPCNYKKN